MKAVLGASRLSFWGIICICVLSMMVQGMSGAWAGNVPKVPGISGSSAELHIHYDKSLRGKKIGFVPLALGSPLMDSWDYSMRKEALECGMIYEVKDPNWNSQASAQAVSAFIAQHVDVLVVHNMNMELLARLLDKAEKAGIFVLQINMVSNQKTDAFIGVDWYTMGLRQAEKALQVCKNATPANPAKIAITQGELTSAANSEQVEAMMSVFRKHPEVKVVASQACNWNSNTAHDNMATIIKQHPDLKVSIGIWDIMDLGAAQAIKEAGLKDKVYVITSGGGSSQAYDGINAGLIDSHFNYHSLNQGHDLMSAAKFLLQSGLKPGQIKLALYSPITEITKKNVYYEFYPYPFPEEMKAALSIKYPRLPLPSK